MELLIMVLDESNASEYIYMKIIFYLALKAH